MKRLPAFLTAVSLLLAFNSLGAVNLYFEDYSVDAGNWTAIGDGSVSHNASGGYVEVSAVGAVVGSGGFSFGPGKTALSPEFGTLTQSVDIYIDPSAETAGADNIWSLSTNIDDDADSNILEFDFYGKWVQDNGEGDTDFEDLDGDSDTTDWIYKIGRNNDWRTAPVLVETAGWYTFVSEWIDDGSSSSLVNNHYIFDSIGTELFKGTAAGIVSTSATGYLTGYTWAYYREGSGTTLEVDNLSYDLQPVPESSTYAALLGLSALFLVFAKRFRKSTGRG